MTWLGYALVTAVLWAAWSFLGKVALRAATPAQATLLFGVASLIAGGAMLALTTRSATWSAGALWAGAISAACGSAGMITFYLAFEHGRASLVAPVIGLYPAVVAVLWVACLSHRLSVVQWAGIALAIVGIAPLGAGG